MTVVAQTTGVVTTTGRGDPMETPQQTPALTDIAAAPTSAAMRIIFIFMVFCSVVALHKPGRTSNHMVTYLTKAYFALFQWLTTNPGLGAPGCVVAK
jgi:hypothetical protein